MPALIAPGGPANWALSAWLDRLLPQLAVEARDRLPDPSRECTGYRTGR